MAVAAASADPRLQAVLVAAQALQPAIVQLESLRDIGLMTQPQVDLAVEQMKGNMVTVHNAFLAALASHPVA